MTDAELHREATDAYFGAADPAGTHCPECGSDDIYDPGPDDYVHECNACGEEWTE